MSDMTTNVLPLEELANHIKQQEAALGKLREEYDARKSQLGELTRKREQLLAELQKIDAELGHAPEKASAPAAKPAPVVKSAPAAKVTASAPKKTEGKVSFSQFLFDCVKAAGKPISAKELTDEVIRQGFPTSSQNIRGMVDTRIGDLVRKGWLKRSKDGSGVVVREKASASATAAEKPAAPAAGQKAQSPAKSAPAKKASSVPAAKPVAKAVEAAKKESLYDVLLRIFAKSSKALSIRELTEKVLAQGYATESSNFQKVVAVRLANMSEVERVDDHTYALKKAKGKKG